MKLLIIRTLSVYIVTVIWMLISLFCNPYLKMGRQNIETGETSTKLLELGKYNMDIDSWHEYADEQKVGVMLTKERVSRLTSKEEINIAKYEGKSALFDAKNKFQNEIAKYRGAKTQAYIDHVMFNRALRDGKTNFKENMTMNWKNSCSC